MKAFILAAGNSIRFGEDKLQHHFSFGRLIDLSIKNIRKIGIEPFVVTDNPRNFYNCNANIIYKDPKLLGSYGSIISIIDYWEEGSLILDGDIIYHPEILLMVSQCKFNVCASSSLDIITGDELYIFKDLRSKIRLLSKDKTKSKFICESQFIGIVKFQNLNFDLLNRLYDPYKKELCWEEDIIPLMNVEDLEFNLPWFEVDFQNHINRCEKVYEEIHKE